MAKDDLVELRDRVAVLERACLAAGHLQRNKETGAYELPGSEPPAPKEKNSDK